MNELDWKIHKGYKKTEIGVIPEDWRAMRVQDFAPLQRGFDLPSSKLKEGQYPVVYSNGILNRHNSFMVKKPGVVTGRSGTIGKVHYINENYWPHNTTLWVTDFKGNDPLFVFHFYSQIEFERFGTGSGVPTLNRNDVHDHIIPVPPKNEQIAIATVLSDTDALIDNLEKLITKKTAIKMGAMQQLLIGERRLAGFERRKGYKKTEIGVIPEDWDLISYDEAFMFLRTASYSRAQLRDDGGVSYVHYGDIHTRWNNYVDLRCELPQIETNKASNYSLIKDGDLIMADASEDYQGIGKSVEVINKGNIQAISGLHTFLLRDKEEYFVNGFRGYIHTNRLVKAQIDRLATGLKVYGVSKNNLKLILIPRPSLPEQSAIAKTLFDMSSEIEDLKKTLQKYRQIKTGMMQQLLTGKIRVYEPQK